MYEFEKLTDYIYRLKVPFEGGYTAVFLIEEKGKFALVDCATTAYDVNEIILPALEKINVVPDEIVLSHSHGDHAGGLDTLLQKLPEIKIGTMDGGLKAMLDGFDCELISDGDTLFDSVKILSLPGHCDEAVGLLDKRTNTLLSCDCVQLYGIGIYGTGLSDAQAYYNTLARIRSLPVENLIAAHEYDPLGAEVKGRSEVLRYLEVSENYAREIEKFVKQRIDLDGDSIAAEWNSSHPTNPTISGWTMNNFKK